MRKRVLSLAAILAVMAVMLMPAPVMAASGGQLVKQVSLYNYNAANKWEQYGKYAYSYEKGYPSVYTESYNFSEELNILSYKMKNGRPVSAKHINSVNRNDENWKYDKKGRLVKNVFGGIFNKMKITRTYKYNKQGFVTKYDYTYRENQPGLSTYTMKDEFSYKYSMVKGLPKEMLTTYTETYSDGTKETRKYKTAYNSKGLIESLGYLKDDGTYGINKTVKYTYKNGKVTSAVISNKDYEGNDGDRPEQKIVFKYADGKAGKTRYINMINSFVSYSAGYENEYGIYNWF